MSNLSTLDNRTKRRILKEHRGILSRVARRCKVTPQAVRLIFWGQGVSRFISFALEAELASLGVTEMIQEARK